jgi:hypothetical protein
MNKYLDKDVKKFSICNKLISQGSTGSSSHRYSLGELDKYRNKPLIINADEYTRTDIVGVSVNGYRKDRVSFDNNLVLKAIAAGATIVKDNEYNTERKFNIGERELRDFLKENGYHLILDDPLRSVWRES